ncbi:MAG: Uma2 family endonuclease [Ginsengibacter sp.]
MNSILNHPPKSMLEVWETLPEGTLCQLINNKLVMSAAPKDIHQAVLFDIAFEIQTYLKGNKLGKLRIAPYDVHFSKQNIFQPDLVFIKSENMHRIEQKGLIGAPDLVIEVLSQATAQLDFGEKKSVYENYGVEEYFIVNPDSGNVDCFYLVNGIYEKKESEKGKIVSKVLGTEITF